MKETKEKVGSIYIDNANLLNHLKQASGNRESGGKVIDYGKLCLYIRDFLNDRLGTGVRIHSVKLYDGIVKNDGEKRLKKERFIFSVERRLKEVCGEDINFQAYLFEIVLGRQRRIKGDDIKLALDVYSDIVRDRLDFVVLLSGDGDFASLLDYVKRSFEITVVVVAFKSFCNKVLCELSDHFLDLEEALGEVAFA
ncbi:MAG: NYN domain-containing protein [Aquificae bacterium]|nr:NYN domain-containing protein [Aquificota bacterium]